MSKSPSQGSDRRTHERKPYPMRQAIAYYKADPSLARLIFQTVTLRDLSPAGFSFTSEGPPPEAELVLKSAPA